MNIARRKEAVAKRIVRRDCKAASPQLADLPELLQRIYTFRDIQGAEEISRELVDLLPFSGMKGIVAAAQRLVQAIQRQQRIIIVGDFDADGATSTALGVRALRAFGAEDVHFLVPNRFHFGYGLTPEIVAVAQESEPDLLITVDNGISSVDGVKAARDAGIDVIITDHHLAPDELPADCIIVNPNQPDDTFASKSIAGVGVIFYVMLAVRAALKSIDWFEDQNIAMPNMAQYLDLVALGTVADVVPLDKNNRIMVHHGLTRIRSGRGNVGILAMIDIAKRKHARMRASDLGYVIGPRLNAAGRLDDMTWGVNCLLSDDFRAALTIARRLDGLNAERREIETEMQVEAFTALDSVDLEQDMLFGACVYQSDWHQGVIGLLAARVKERLHRPVVAFANEDDENLKGSARSVSGLHIRDALDAMAKRYPGLITKFGGHAMAAGLSIKKKDYERFAVAFNEVVSERVSLERLQAEVWSDGELSSDHFNLQTAELLRQAGPWGQGFPEPLFDGEFAVIEQRIVGGHHLKMLLMPKDSDYCMDAIAFNVDVEQWPNERCNTIKVAYRLDINEFRGREKLQLLVEELVVAD